MERYHFATPMKKLSSPASAAMQKLRKISKRKRVNFVDEVDHIIWVPSDPVAAWLSALDYRAIKERVQPIVNAMRRNQKDYLKREEVCVRGLEHLQSSMHLERQLINKDCAMNAVFTEQEKQRSSGIRDELEIANACQAASRWARNQALQYGASDEAAIRLEIMRSHRSCRSGLSNLSLGADGGSSSLPQQKKQFQRCNEEGLVRQSEEMRTWLDHEDSLRMTHLQARNQSQTRLNSKSSYAKSNGPGTSSTPLPDGTPPKTEQAFAA